MSRTERWPRRAALLVLILATAISLTPTVYMIDMSLRDSAQTFAPVLIAPNPIFSNYTTVLATSGLERYFLNSVAVAGGTVVLTIGAATTLSFAIARLKMRGGGLLLLMILGALLLPLASLLIPITVLLKNLGLTNTWVGLIGPETAIGIPFATVILKEAMEGVPDELEEAATIDGASSFTVLWKIIVPLIRPALIVVAIWQFLYSWSEFFLALVIMTQNDEKTLPLAPLYYQGPYMSDPGKLFAILTLIAIVPMIVYALVQRWFVSGLMAGGVKG